MRGGYVIVKGMCAPVRNQQKIDRKGFIDTRKTFKHVTLYNS